ncbi:MAG: glutamine--fructose-6-phosphate transaminase (isomerizing) [Treponema sp.]|nr:glutamine--fructose-6-phosphate transaminase (isomerizing) [Treponema sp.]
MCGIIGYIGMKEAVPILLGGLKKLEYRGYDSAGIAVLGRGGLAVSKEKGRLSALESRLAASPLEGTLGIGHTRWATHGEPSDLNSHPHLGEQQKIAVVHNGIIENYRQLKEKLVQRGAAFQSETDTEVIAHLAEQFYRGDLKETMIKLSEVLEGSYALGIICADKPEVLGAIKKDSPLIAGLSEHGAFIASDIPAILEHTREVYYLQDREIALLGRDSCEFFDPQGEPLIKEKEEVTWSLDSAEKGGHPHFMFKEILEQGRVLRETIQDSLWKGRNHEVLEGLDIARYRKIVITGCGSAYNAALVGKYVFEELCRVPVEIDIASEFRYRDPIIDASSLVVLISQSGETADTIAALRLAKEKGAATLGIVNVVGSTIAKEAELCLFTSAGPEIAVATTKAFSAQLVLLYIFSVHSAAALGAITKEEAQILGEEIQSLPDKAEEVLSSTGMIQKHAASWVGKKSIFFIGRNIDYAIAAEGSLKLKEISYIHSEAYAGGELKHGTISLIEDNTLVVSIASRKALYPKIMSNTEQVISRGARVLLVGNAEVSGMGDDLVQLSLPRVYELFSPSLSVLVLQLLAYYIAANKGLDIDKPRNLAKSVTVE